MPRRIRRNRLFVLTITVTMATVYTSFKVIHLQKSPYNDPCQQTAGWSRSDMTDWSFQKVLKCPNFTLNSPPLDREMSSLQCNGGSVKLVSRATRKSSDIFSIPFGDKCLIQYIDNHCLGNRTVPNVVHYIWYNDYEMDFSNFISFMSTVKFVKPCLILIHGSFLPYGKYWDYFVHVFSNIIQVNRNLTTTFGEYRLLYPEHGSDIMRIQALDVYGGLYLDWDEVVLRPIDCLRDYPMTMGLELPNRAMGSQFIMAQKGAAFLHLWLHSYRVNYREDWMYNALEVPFKLSKQLPDLIHVESNRFTRPNGYQTDLIYNKNFDWSDNFAMHLFSRLLRYRYRFIYKYDETVIGQLNVTLGSVARHILFNNKELCK